MKQMEYYVNGKEEQIVIDVPKELRGKLLKVVVMENEEENLRKFSEMPVEERLRVLEEFKGSAKYPDVQINKYDVYDQ